MDDVVTMANLIAQIFTWSHSILMIDDTIFISHRMWLYNIYYKCLCVCAYLYRTIMMMTMTKMIYKWRETKEIIMMRKNEWRNNNKFETELFHLTAAVLCVCMCEVCCVCVFFFYGSRSNASFHLFSFFISQKKSCIGKWFAET